MAVFKTYRSKRRLVQILSTIVIIVLPFLNILRLDIPTLRFYFFHSVLWVDEFYLLFLVVMLVMWLIVFFSMVYGRVWCGWMCPQTVLNELIYWLENRLQRWLKVPRRKRFTARHGVMYTLLSLAAAGLALIIGFNLVAYFVDPYRMLNDIWQGQLGSVTLGIIVAIAVLVFIDIMFWREKFCTRVCPYGMMQVVVTDSRSQIVRYHTERAEECIDCQACVRICMMGIDIRTSPYQTECTHCGDCVDACTAVLERLNKSTLITFSWGETQRKEKWWEKIGLVDGKRRVMLALIGVYTLGLVALIHNRQPISISATGDRSTLYRQENGAVINDYFLRISNRSLEERTFRLECAAPFGHVEGCRLLLERNPITLKSREVQTLKLSIAANSPQLHPGPNRLHLQAVDVTHPNIRAKTEIVFFMPEEEPFQLSSQGGKLPLQP